MKKTEREEPSQVGIEMTGHFLCHNQAQAEGRILDQAQKLQSGEDISRASPIGWHSGLGIREGPNIRPVSHVGHLVCALLPRRLGTALKAEWNLQHSAVWSCPYGSVKRNIVHDCWCCNQVCLGSLIAHLSGAWTPPERLRHMTSPLFPHIPSPRTDAPTNKSWKGEGNWRYADFLLFTGKKIFESIKSEYEKISYANTAL